MFFSSLPQEKSGDASKFSQKQFPFIKKGFSYLLVVSFVYFKIVHLVNSLLILSQHSFMEKVLRQFYGKYMKIIMQNTFNILIQLAWKMSLCWKHKQTNWDLWFTS